MNAQEFITIPKGTVIKIKGIPFELKEDTKVLGLESNYKLALSQSEHCLSKPVQAELNLACSTTRSLSLESICGIRLSLICDEDKLDATIHVESRQCHQVP